METVWHSDDFGIKKLTPELMTKDISKNKEGVGIYFTSNPDVKYGKHTVKTEVNPNDFLDSRTPLKRLNQKNLLSFLQALQKHDSEEFWYFISDFIEVHSEKDVNDSVLKEFLQSKQNEELRNFQLEIVETFGEIFVPLWVKNMKTKGNKLKYTNSENWYIIMDVNQKLEIVL